ncbi:MAG TPA: ATPase, T2SS/T4P/T4SS family, partial [Planctomycetaceae bacterium]
MARDWLQSFIDRGLISEDQLEEARVAGRRMGISPGEALVKLGYVEPSDIADAQASQFGQQFVSLDGMEIPQGVIELVNESLARENTIIPIRTEEGSVVVAFHDPMALDVLDKLRFILNRDVKIVVAPKEQIQAAIDRHYGQSETQSVDSMIQEFTETQIDFTATEAAVAPEEEDENAPVVRLVNLILTEAVKMRASDIHIEPFEDRVRIRYRIDGQLMERDAAPRRLLGSMVSRIKIMASMDISERRRPQDGRIKTRIGGKDFDLRVSILPTNHGQAVVLRILDRDNIKIGIRN